MNAKTYKAETMGEALAEIKRDLGRDAVILHTRNVRRGGLLGFIGGKLMWEVTATPHMRLPARTPQGKYLKTERLPIDFSPIFAPPPKIARPAPTFTPPPQSAAPAATFAPVPMVAAPAPVFAPEPGIAYPAPSVPPSPAPSTQGDITTELTEIRGMVQMLVSRGTQHKGSDVAIELLELHEELVRRDVDRDLATELMKQLQGVVARDELTNKRLVREKLIDLISQSLPVVGSDGPSKRQGEARVIALIGPTGVGKTTTIAKLAAEFKLKQNKRVGLITVDTYRIAAVDQLRTYAEIIQVPIHAVLTGGELHQGIHAMNDLDVIIIDTAGRSPNDQMHLNQLRDFLTAAAPDEIHLVVSANANLKCTNNTLERFVPLGADRIIISKIDEAETFGMILTVGRSRIPLSYVTTGQDVPDDIAVPDAGRLARWIVGEESYVS